MTTPLIEAMAEGICVYARREVSWELGAVPVITNRSTAIAQAALTAITEAGYAVVPVEPTEAMCAEASEPAQAAALYRAMISAAQGDG